MEIIHFGIDYIRDICWCIICEFHNKREMLSAHERGKQEVYILWILLYIGFGEYYIKIFRVVICLPMRHFISKTRQEYHISLLDWVQIFNRNISLFRTNKVWIVRYGLRRRSRNFKVETLLRGKLSRFYRKKILPMTSFSQICDIFRRNNRWNK